MQRAIHPSTNKLSKKVRWSNFWNCLYQLKNEIRITKSVLEIKCWGIYSKTRTKPPSYLHISIQKTRTYIYVLHIEVPSSHYNSVILWSSALLRNKSLWIMEIQSFNFFKLCGVIDREGDLGNPHTSSSKKELFVKCFGNWKIIKCFVIVAILCHGFVPYNLRTN